MIINVSMNSQSCSSDVPVRTHEFLPKHHDSWLRKGSFLIGFLLTVDLAVEYHVEFRF